jgi:hypothetical protein
MGDHDIPLVVLFLRERRRVHSIQLEAYLGIRSSAA